MRIRRPAPPDRDGIAAVLRSDSTFHADEVDCALELVDSALATPGKDYSVLVCEDEERGDQIVGYICYGPTPMTTGTWDLYWIAVHAQARGRGLARRLCEAMEGELREHHARIIRLETSQMEAYGSARALYERMGYVEVGRIPEFYHPGDDLIIFAKRM
jgi:ribosomal protein S18 acetylase RimI-like enzyme